MFLSNLWIIRRSRSAARSRSSATRNGISSFVADGAVATVKRATVKKTAAKKQSVQGPKRYGAEPVEFSREEAFRPRGGAKLDDADMRIIDMLVRDGRTN